MIEALGYVHGAKEIQDGRLFMPANELCEGRVDGVLLGFKPAHLAGFGEQLVVDLKIGGHVSHIGPHISCVKSDGASFGDFCGRIGRIPRG